jgi:hypothetical protein
LWWWRLLINSTHKNVIERSANRLLAEGLFPPSPGATPCRQHIIRIGGGSFNRNAVVDQSPGSRISEN